MIRFLFFLLVVLGVSLLFLNNKKQFSNTEKPIFLKYDEISNKHKTKLNVKINSKIIPNEQQLEMFKKDYAHIWAHLNNLFETNNVIEGKEYYTEEWFNQICLNYKKSNKQIIYRQDLSHQLTIKNWALDDLLCTITDKVKVAYIFPDKSIATSNLNIAMVLLFQGDHWRIDAIKVNNHL